MRRLFTFRFWFVLNFISRNNFLTFAQSSSCSIFLLAFNLLNHVPFIPPVLFVFFLIRICVLLAVIILSKKFILTLKFIDLGFVFMDKAAFILLYFDWFFVGWRCFWVLIVFLMKRGSIGGVGVIGRAALFSPHLLSPRWRHKSTIILCENNLLFYPRNLILFELNRSIKPITDQPTLIMRVIWADNMLHIYDISCANISLFIRFRSSFSNF